MRDRRRHVWGAAIHICNVLMLTTVTASPLYIPQFLSGGSGRNIRHLPCVSTRTGETGVCMFAFTCAKANGTHLGTCIDRFYFGSCCRIEQEPDDVFPQDNTIEDGPLPPPEPLFTTTLSSIESNEIPPYFTKPKPILEKRPSLSGPSTQRIETTTTSTIVETIATKYPQKMTSVKPIIYTTTESVGLSTFQTVQVASTNGIPSRPTLATSQSSTLSTVKPFTSGKPSSEKTSTSIGTTVPSRPSLPPTFPTAPSTSSSYPSSSGSSSTFGPSTTGSTSTSSSTTTSGSPPTTGSTSTSGYTSTSSTPPTSDSTLSFGSLSTSSLPSSTPPSTFTPQKQPTIIDVSSPPLKKNLTQTSETTITGSTKPVEATTKSPLLTYLTTRVPATRFPPRNSTTSKPSKPISSSTTKRPSSTSITKKPTEPSTPDTKKPISATIRPLSSSRPSSPSNATKPASTRPTKPTKPSKPYPSSTKIPSSGKPTVTETIPFGGFKPTKEPTVDKIPPKITTTPKPETTTTKTKTPVKPTKISSSTPSSTKPSSVKPSSVKPSLITGTTNITITTIRSTPKPTTEKPKPKPKPTSTTPSGISSSTPSTTSTTQDSTPKSPVPPTASTESNTYIPLNINQTTNHVAPPKKPEAEPAQTTYGPGLVTWTSSLDETTTYKIPEASSTTEEPSETEWAPITTPDGWVIIHSPTTEKEESSSPSTPKPTTVTTTSVPFFSTKPVTDIPTAGTFITTRPVLPTTLSSIATVTVSTESPQTIMPAINMSDYKQVCGRRLFPEGRIVGGNSSSFGRWPWQISLRQWRTSTYLHKCGAALLNENWAITAAHCVENVPPSDLLLRIGEHDLANEGEPYGYQERRVQLVASHPQFDPRTFEYDLALLRFYEPIQPFQPNILPICLPDDDESFVGHTAYVTGWGRLYEDGPLPSVLQEVPVPVINNTVCESMYRTAGFIETIPHIFICAGWRKGGFDSCEGDSGGPMVIQRSRDKRWILAGVISWGIGCAEPNQPGVYTRISQFRDWINQILQF